jgi:hypothetical protein
VVTVAVASVLAAGCVGAAGEGAGDGAKAEPGGGRAEPTGQPRERGRVEVGG